MVVMMWLTCVCVVLAAVVLYHQCSLPSIIWSEMFLINRSILMYHNCFQTMNLLFLQLLT